MKDGTAKLAGWGVGLAVWVAINQAIPASLSENGLLNAVAMLAGIASGMAAAKGFKDGA